MRIDEIRASLLRDFCWLLLATTTMGVLVVPFTVTSVPPLFFIPAFTPFYGVIFGALALLHFGARRAAGWVLVLGIFSLQALGNFLNPGGAEQALVSTINLILIGGFALSRRAATIVAGVATVAVLTYLLFDEQGLLPEPMFVLTLIERLPIIGLTVATTGGLMVVSMRHLTRAIDAEQRSLLVARESSQSLSVALDENALRTTLGEELVQMGEQLLQSREELEQLGVLVNTLRRVSGIKTVRVMTEAGDVLVERPASTTSVDAAGAGGMLQLQLEGLEAPLILVIRGEQALLESAAAADFFQTAMGLLVTAGARVRAERQLQQAEQVQAVARLAAGISHDFNNLLVAILGGLELATHHAAEGRDALPSIQIAQRAAHRAVRLTQKMGTLGGARGDDGAATALRTSLPALVETLGASFGKRIEVSFATEIPDVSVRADDVELGQIVENILNNASEAISGQGAIRISVGVEESMVRFDFEDTGAGMPSDVLTRVFEPFFTTRKGVGGHGLGLAGVKALCHAIGGRIEAASTEGVGSCFSVWIPLSDHEASATEPVGRTAPAVDSVMKPTSGPLDGHRVLLVDDDAQVRSMVAALMESMDAEVHVAESGARALDMLDALSSITLLVSDVRMPGMDGHALLRTVRERGYRFPTILASGFDPVDPPDAHELGRFVRLAKPFTRAQMLETIESIR